MEYDLLDRRRHPHPLLFEREGKYDGVCSKCCEPLLHEPSFRCSDSDCNFQIHPSCIHLPQKIESHFHPQHPLFLKYNGGHHCDACGETEQCVGAYGCYTCWFGIDIKCAIANIRLCETSSGKYVYMSHPQHPLTLALSPPLEQRQQNGGEIKKLLDCVICKWLIEPGSSTNYFCSQCDDDGDFHKECAELPMQLKIPVHPHPLFLLKRPHNNCTLCHVCRNECEGFAYMCLECIHFQLHIPCLQSYAHKHKFTKLQIITEFTCSVCGEKSKDRFVVCNICHMLVHEKCVEFPSTLRIYEHQDHDLTYFPYYNRTDWEVDHCTICGKKINSLYAGYVCNECNYFSHLKCALGRCVEPQSTAAVAAEKESIEQHFDTIHPHKLALFPPKEIDNVEYKVCDGCMKFLSDSGPSYGCRPCDFFLDEDCAKLPTIIVDANSRSMLIQE